VLDELRGHFNHFERAFEPDGLRLEEFATFGPSVRTLRTFIASYHDLLHLVNEALLPNPDLRPA
jgi:transaldolase